MIKTVVQAMPTHVISCLLLSSEVTKELRSLSTRFFWSPDVNERKLCWCAWNCLCKCKGAGGYGFRDIGSFSKAMLAK